MASRDLKAESRLGIGVRPGFQAQKRVLDEFSLA